MLRNCRDAVIRLAAELGRPVESVGIGIPGNVDVEHGIVRFAVNLGITELDLAGGVGDLVDGPVVIDNDVNVTALGAFATLATVPRSMAYLNVGTGLAAGLILDGQVWRGSGGVAGEIGHISFDRSGPRCPCGQRGCLEMIASGSGIARQWTGPVLFADAVRGGDATAHAILDRAVGGIADAVQLLVLTAGVERVVLGGGIVHATPTLAHALRTRLRERAAESGFLSSIGFADRADIETESSEFPVLGAAVLAGQPRPAVSRR